MSCYEYLFWASQKGKNKTETSISSEITSRVAKNRPSFYDGVEIYGELQGATSGQTFSQHSCYSLCAAIDMDLIFNTIIFHH